MALALLCVEISDDIEVDCRNCEDKGQDNFADVAFLVLLLCACCNHHIEYKYRIDYDKILDDKPEKC